LDAEKVISIPTGADVSRFHPGDRLHARMQIGLSADDSIVGIVATLRSWKGHRFALSAMLDQRLARARLLIVGGGPQDSALREQAASQGLTDRVLFAGQQSNVVPWLQAMDVFTLPSTGNEGVPQALVQAMACGIPVVTTPVGAIPEVVTHDRTGLIVPTEDTVRLGDAIVRLLHDSVLSQRLSNAAREHVTQRFSTASMLEAMERTLLRAAKDRR
jgi:glycosyltransferase involved in cell wall biosynthesis